MAVENAIKAYRMDGGKHWDCLGTLAAAYAECGDFGEACKWQSEALSLAGENQSLTQNDKAEIRARLELYKARKPCREQPRSPDRASRSEGNPGLPTAI